jgi:RecA/RadA recombinase
MFYNNEFGAPPSYWESYGIDTDKIVHCPFADMEELKFDIPKQLQEIKRDDKVLFFIDSIGNAASKKEVEDALNEKSVADMTRAKQMKSIFRIITPHLTLKDIPMIAINHTYQEQGMFPKTIVSGGTGVMYSADNVFIMGRQKDANGTEIQGWNFVLNIEKSRFVKEKSKINLKITYENGIDIYSGILDLAIECGLLVQSGAWYQLVDLKTGEVNPAKIRKSAVNAAVLDPIIASDKFKEFVSNKYRVSSGKMFKEDSTESEAEEYMESLEDE